MSSSDLPQSMHYIDYDLISLTNAFQKSFQNGVERAAFIMNAPLLLIDQSDNILAVSHTENVNNISWPINGTELRFSSTSLRNDPKVTACAVPQGRGWLYYLTNGENPTPRQTQLAPYVAWILLSSFESNSDWYNPQAPQRGHLLSKLLLCKHDTQFPHDFSTNTGIPKLMQIAAVCDKNQSEDHICDRISLLSSLLNTDLLAQYKNRYFIALTAALTNAEKETLKDKLCSHEIHMGLSCKFEDIRSFDLYLQQAITASRRILPFAADSGLLEYRDYFPADLFNCYEGLNPLSSYRHPVFRILSKTDSELLDTLCAYLELNGKIMLVAERLHLHRNSVNYRLSRIKALTGYDITDPLYWTALRYAMELEHFINASPDEKE